MSSYQTKLPSIIMCIAIPLKNWDRKFRVHFSITIKKPITVFTQFCHFIFLIKPWLRFIFCNSQLTPLKKHYSLMSVLISPISNQGFADLQGIPFGLLTRVKCTYGVHKFKPSCQKTFHIFLCFVIV